MQPKQFAFAVLGTVSLWILPEYSSVAFSIVYNASGPYAVSTRTYSYSIGTQQAKVQTNLKPYLGLSRPSAGDSTLTFLNNLYGGAWNFQPASQDLIGNFYLADYYACVPNMGFPCGKDVAITTRLNVSQTVGAAMDIFYAPDNTQGTTDPIVDTSLHWIQIVTSSDGSTQNPTIIDNVPKSNSGPPFYPLENQRVDSNTQTKLLNLPDAPQRNDFTIDYDWSAKLFLVREISVAGSTARTLELFNGMEWGWTSKYTPPPPATPSPASAPASGHKGLKPPSNPKGVCPPGMPPSSCEAFGYYARQDAVVNEATLDFNEFLTDSTAPSLTDAASVSEPITDAATLMLHEMLTSTASTTSNALGAPELPADGSTSSFDGFATSSTEPAMTNAAGVPEPSSVAGAIVAVGLWGGVAWRKRKLKPLDQQPNPRHNP